jgi:hypothetical protein
MNMSLKKSNCQQGRRWMQRNCKNIRRQLHHKKSSSKSPKSIDKKRHEFKSQPRHPSPNRNLSANFPPRLFAPFPARRSSGPWIAMRMVTGPSQPWMRNTVLSKFGRTMPKVWKSPTNKINPYRDPMRDDGKPIDIKDRIRFWKLARGDRVRIQLIN